MTRTPYSRILWICLLACPGLSAQQPKYTSKHFVDVLDTTKFKVIVPGADGFVRTYLSIHPAFWDLDDDSSTYIRGGANALVCIEGSYKNSKREGVFNAYLIDSFDHAKRYKIWEQTYANDKLNGQWRTYTLRGTLVNFQTYKDDSLDGLTRNFWIDGKTVIEEQVYFNGRNKYIQREFNKSGKVESEIPFEDGKINGVGRKYYDDGKLKQVVNFKDGQFDGTNKYYYPNGQLWIEQEYKMGKNWNVVANFTDKGEKRDAGTLHNGNGSVIYYNDDGTVREVIRYFQGDPMR